MPSLCLHATRAQQVAERLSGLIPRGHRGTYLLGATAPDIRVIIAQSRQETHFFDLSSRDPESSVATFFQAHPVLRRGAELAEATRVFVAGYLCHLVTDEIWILEVYRPCFGPASPLARDPMTNLLDRVLQFELDRRERLDRDKMAALRAELSLADPGAAPGLMEEATLLRWRDLMMATLARPFSWDNFRSFGERFLRGQEQVSRAQMEDFLAALPAMVDKVLKHVTKERLFAFREKSLQEGTAVVKEYLA